jgi:predicted permease
MRNQLSDLVHAARTILKARAFAVVCVLSLGVGMGVVIGIMLLSRMVSATPPGVNDDGLVELVIRPQGALKAQAGRAIIDEWSYPDYLDIRDAASGMAITGWGRGEASVRLPNQAAPTSTAAMYVSSNYFSTIGVMLARGRGFTAADDASVAPAEVVIGSYIWQVRFGSDPEIVGKTVTINQTEYSIVGVTPEGFRAHVGGIDSSYYNELWLPLSRHPRLSGDDNVRLKRESGLMRIVARLSPGTTLPQADAMVQSAMRGLAARYPSSSQDKVGGVEAYFPAGARMRSQINTGRMILLGLAGMVLLVVGLNVSGMMLVRSAMRERELAIRLAMGASRWRLMRYHLTEAFVLAVLGGSLASALLFGVPVIVAWWFNYYGPALDVFRPDAWLVLQCIGLCFVTSFGLGWLPARRFSRPAILSALKNDATGSGRRVGRLQRLTAALQAGIAVPFLVIGLIRVDQARMTAMADLGFQPHGLYAVRVNLPAIGKSEDDRRRFVQTVLDGLAQAPGVTSVSIGDGVPLDFIYRNTRVARERESGFVAAHSTRIDAGYLDAVGIRLLAGRPIDVNDRAGAERVVLLSEPLARQLFPDGHSIGERVDFALDGSAQQTYTVVGVTADLVSAQIANPRPQLFVSLAQHPARTVLAIARGGNADPSMRRTFEHALAAGDPGFVLRELITGQVLIDRNHSDILTEGMVSGIAASVALVLATLGVYGVIAFMVATRTREVGVRMALGASRGRIVRDVLVDALTLVVPGIGLGLIAAGFIVRVLDPSWYPLGTVEPLIYTLAAVTSFVVAAIAGLPSARRAARVQPMDAMRAE